MTTTPQAWPLHPQRGVHSQTARTPPRRVGSLRRTTTLDYWWPQGMLGPCAVLGSGRDLLTRSDGARVLHRAEVHATLSPPGATVTELAGDLPDAVARGLLGASVSTGFRRILQGVVPPESRMGMSYRLLHDLPGATLVSQSVPIHAGHTLFEPSALLALADACQGWRTGEYQMNEVGAGRMPLPIGPVPNDLDDGSDPLAWHEVNLPPGDTFRRSRRLDLWREDEVLAIDLHYRDAYRPVDRPGMVVHEYSVRARADPATLTLQQISTEAHALPWATCNSVVSTSDELLGVRLGACDVTVRTRLRGTAGCTHLNDSLRELDEVPTLAAALATKGP